MHSNDFSLHTQTHTRFTENFTLTVLIEANFNANCYALMFFKVHKAPFVPKSKNLFIFTSEFFALCGLTVFDWKWFQNVCQSWRSLNNIYIVDLFVYVFNTDMPIWMRILSDWLVYSVKNQYLFSLEFIFGFCLRCSTESETMLVRTHTGSAESKRNWAKINRTNHTVYVLQ